MLDKKKPPSFALAVKNEIFTNKLYRSKLKKAYGYGFLLFSKSFNQEYMHITTENRALARLYSNILYDLVPINGTVTIKEVRHIKSNTVYTAMVDNFSDRLTILETFGNRDKLNINYNILSAENEKSAFLSGAFLACGNINDPKKSYHLEFTMSNEILAQELSDFLTNINIKHGITERRAIKVIYIKESEQIEDILTIMNATKSLFELMDVKIIKEIRNRANRVTNCETANIDKTVNAASEQLEAINRIDGFIGLDALEPELREIAEIRIANPDASLREIGELSTVTLSRSAVNHRIKKILQIAKNLA